MRALIHPCFLFILLVLFNNSSVSAQDQRLVVGDQDNPSFGVQKKKGTIYFLLAIDNNPNFFEYELRPLKATADSSATVIVIEEKPVLALSIIKSHHSDYWQSVNVKLDRDQPRQRTVQKTSISNLITKLDRTHNFLDETGLLFIERQIKGVVFIFEEQNNFENLRTEQPIFFDDLKENSLTLIRGTYPIKNIEKRAPNETIHRIYSLLNDPNAKLTDQKTLLRASLKAFLSPTQSSSRFEPLIAELLDSDKSMDSIRGSIAQYNLQTARANHFSKSEVSSEQRSLEDFSAHPIAQKVYELINSSSYPKAAMDIELSLYLRQQMGLNLSEPRLHELTQTISQNELSTTEIKHILIENFQVSTDENIERKANEHQGLSTEFCNDSLKGQN